jgi:hypothetical protein
LRHHYQKEALMFGLSSLKLGLGIGALILIALFALSIKLGINKIAAQGKEIATLKTDLATEKAARQKDVQGLTVLAQGMIAASSARALDERTLGETINASNPNPVSPDLGAFLDRLRVQAGSNTGSAPSTAGAGAAARPRAGAGNSQR